MGSDWADIDNDGNMDLFVGDMSATTHRMAKILMGDMSQQRHFLIHSRPQQYMRNALLLNTGTERFEEVGFLAGVASTDWTWSTLFGDLDCDGRLDLFCTNGIARFDMDPDVTLRVKDLFDQRRYEEMVGVIQNIRAVAESNIALRNAGDLEFVSSGADWGLDLKGISHGAALTDLDRDGDLDVITNNFNADVGLWENLSDSPNALAVELRGSRSNRFGVGARVEMTTADGTQVRENWLSRGYLSGQEPRLLFGLGKRTRVDRLIVRWPSGHVQEVTELSAGQSLRIREPAGQPPVPTAAVGPAQGILRARDLDLAAHRERPFDDYADQPLLPHKLSQLGPGVAVGDYDGDGRDDLFVGGAAGQAGTLLRHGRTREDQGGAAPWLRDEACEDMGVLWLDYDSDGDQDLFVVSGGVEAPPGDELLRDRLYRNDDGTFTRDRDALPDLRFSGSSCCAADVDGDGDLDLFVGGRTVPGSYPDAPASRLLRNDSGRFTDATAELAPALLRAGMVSGAVFADGDGDGLPDLLIAARWQPLRYLRNTGGRLLDETDTAQLADHTGWWNSITALDVDGDGDTDFVAGNQGRNTKYEASPDHPLILYYSDFDDNGTRDLVETKYEDDRLLPVRGRSCSSNAMPFLLRKFPTYEKFASAVLQDIYPQPKLDSAARLQVTCLDSVLLRNDGNARFSVEALPRRAQIAPLFGLAVADFDGDGYLDVACATNFFSAEPETGRFDGGLGLLLRGDGSGLLPVPALEAGLALSGDQKGAAVANFDATGRPDLLLARNHGALACFSATSPAPGLCVILSGPPGNPTGVGAVVVVEHDSGQRQRTEVLAGSGYLSQSSASLQFRRGASPITAIVVTWPDRTAHRQTTGLRDPSIVIAWK